MDTLVYKITNIINNKVYIGKTNTSLEIRFHQHLLDSRKITLKDRPLYRAINKYGIQEFIIELIEKCESRYGAEREIFWIKYYDSFHSGYNATYGGEGKSLYNYNEIRYLIENQKTTQEIISQIGCCADIVRLVANIYQLEIFLPENSLQRQMLENKIAVSQYNLQNNFIQNFESYASAARWLRDNKYVSNNLDGVRSKIALVCNGKRKTAYKFVWKKYEAARESPHFGS